MSKGTNPDLVIARILASANAVLADPARANERPEAEVLRRICTVAIEEGMTTLRANQLCTLIGAHVMRVSVNGSGTTWLAK